MPKASNKRRPSKRQQDAQGIEALLKLGFTQAQLARMFDADSATINQWLRFGRVGDRLAGRVEFIPELRGKITLATLRPTLTSKQRERTLRNAEQWSACRMRRIREVPGERRNTAKFSMAKKYHSIQRSIAYLC